jgi:hypothetical protein
MIILNPKHRQKYWCRKTLAATKYWLHQKIIVAYKILAKYSRRQNVAVDKMLASTKYMRRQKTPVDKMSVKMSRCQC